MTTTTTLLGTSLRPKVATGLIPEGADHRTYVSGRLTEHVAARRAVSRAYALPAYAFAFSDDPSPVGVDLEPIDREVSAEAVAWMTHPGDQVGDLDMLARWCVKEAVYKAAPVGSTLQGHRLTVLTVLDGEARGIGWAPGRIRLRWHTEILPIGHASYRLAVAWTDQQPLPHEQEIPWPR